MNEKQTPAQSVRPTKKQRELLDFIEQFIAEHGYSPSYREIMNGLNYISVATVSLHVNSLIRRGHLIKRDRSARSLEVVHSGSAAAAMPSATDTKLPGEQWFSNKVEDYISGISAFEPDPDILLKVEVLHEAAKILGLQSIADETAGQLAALQARFAADSAD